MTFPNANPSGSDPGYQDPGTGTGAGYQPTDPAQGGAPVDPFYPADQVPPSEQSRWKDMQAAYTRKTQQLAEERKELQAAAYKSQVLDQLLENPRFQELVRKLQEEEAAGQTPYAAEWDGADDVEDPRLRQVTEQVKHLERTTAQLQQQRLVEDFKRANPDWEQHKDGMAAAWRENPQRSIQDAYDRALALEYKKLRSQSQQQQRMAGASVEAPTNQRPAGQPPKPVTSMREAAARAAQALGIPLDN